MKIYILGSCSGTEPMPGRHHTSVALEINDRIYFFDAGENCSHTAHIMGIDLLRITDIFISHTHMDHIGGLANLLWNIRKLTFVKCELPRYGDICIHIPNLKIFDALMGLLSGTEGSFRCEYKNNAEKISDGVIFKNEDVEVTALHNLHLKQDENGFRSYSFCIKAEGKKIVYSGDIKDFTELSEFLCDGADVLLIETGHHSAVEICKTIKENKISIGKVLFMHHGREILYDADGVLEKIKAILPQTEICNDKDVFEI